MTVGDSFVPPQFMGHKPYLTPEKYKQMYEQSIQDPSTFFGEQGRELLSWIKPFEKTKNGYMLSELFIL